MEEIEKKRLSSVGSEPLLLKEPQKDTTTLSRIKGAWNGFFGQSDKSVLFRYSRNTRYIKL